MIQYHGVPITPYHDCVKILAGRHGMVSYAHKEQIGTIAEVCDSFVLDNGAFSFWKSGKPVNWTKYYDWVETWRKHPCFDWCVIPDIIDGSEEDNDMLCNDWPFSIHIGVPVWHMHESVERLLRLAQNYPRIALGSSGEYASVGTAAWWGRMSEVMHAVCDKDGRPLCKLHGLRMLNPKVFTRLPVSSADSTHVARSIGIDAKWKGTYLPPSKSARGVLLAERVASHRSASYWEFGK